MPILNITRDSILEIQDKYRLDLSSEFTLNLEEFYAVYLNFITKIKKVDRDLIEELNHLKFILAIDNNSVFKFHQAIGASLYSRLLDKTICDGEISKEDQIYLDNIEKYLNISKLLVKDLTFEAKTNFAFLYIDRIIEKENFSPSVEMKLAETIKKLNINFQYGNDQNQKIEKLKSYWEYENEDLRILPTDIEIQKSENCFYKSKNCQLFDSKTIPKHYSIFDNYFNRKVQKSGYINSTLPKFSSSAKLIDRGSVYLTNKRIIFVGLVKTYNIRYEKISDVIPYDDGIEIDRQVRKNTIIQTSDRNDLFYIILERLIRERQ